MSPERPTLRGLQLALLAGSVAVTFQNFVAIPAIPAVDREFHAGTAWSTWLLTAFLLVSCVSAPLLGRIADQYGKRRVLLAAAVPFFVGSVVSSVGTSIGIVIAGRALQGIGGAMIPISFSIVRDVVPRHAVGRAVALQATSLPIGISSALLLGEVADLLSWRYLFGLGAVLTGAAIVLIARHVPETGGRIAAKLDIRGGLLLAVGLVAVLLALTEGETWGWTSTRTTCCFVGGVVVLVAWVANELRVPEPMVDVRMLATRPVLLTNTSTFFSTGLAVTGALVLVPRLLAVPRSADGFGASTAVIGLYMLAWALPGLGAPAVGRLLQRRFGTKWPMVAGCASIAAGLGVAAGWSATPVEVIAALGLIGFGLPIVTSASAHITLLSVGQGETAVALGINNVSRQLGGLIGGQVCAAILASQTIGTSDIPEQSRFVLAFGLCAAAGLVAASVGMFVTERVGQVAAAPASL
jgi:MFS family permease